MESLKTLKNVALFGLGEAGTLIGIDLQNRGITVTAYDPKEVPTPKGICRAQTPHEAVKDAEVIIALTAGNDAIKAIEQAIDTIPATALYADFSTNSAAAKIVMANKAKDYGFDFVDVALMTIVPGKGLRTPVTVSGSGNKRFHALFAPLDMPITLIQGNAGEAATRKLLRSVMMKGLAAVVIESMRAGEAADCSEWLWQNLLDEIAQADKGLVNRLVMGTQTHAHRRLHEMECAAELLNYFGIDSSMTKATIDGLKLVIKDGLPKIPKSK